MEKFLKVVVFKLNEQEYGIDIKQILSIERLQEVTRVPGMSQFIKGVINLRGEITPIIDLKERLSMSEANDTDETKVLVANMNNVQIGLIVDSATDVMDIDPTIIEPAPQLMGSVNEVYLKGVANFENRLLILLDLERVLSYEEIHEVQESID